MDYMKWNVNYPINENYKIICLSKRIISQNQTFVQIQNRKIQLSVHQFTAAFWMNYTLNLHLLSWLFLCHSFLSAGLLLIKYNFVTLFSALWISLTPIRCIISSIGRAMQRNNLEFIAHESPIWYTKMKTKEMFAKAGIVT